MTVTRRQTRPGELFLGGRGILTPYRPTPVPSDTDENKPAASTVSPDPLDAPQEISELPRGIYVEPPDPQRDFEEDNENWTPEMIAPAEELDKIMGWDKQTSQPAIDETPESTPESRPSQTPVGRDS